jgi:hypothetical protein
LAYPVLLGPSITFYNPKAHTNVLILLIISGCALFVEDNPEEIVGQRVNERWDALIEGRLEKAYSFETPEYRELYTFMDYRKTIRGVGSWQKVMETDTR